MKRRKFLRNSTTLISSLPLIQLEEFGVSNTNFLLDTGVVKIKIGNFHCTIIKDDTFKYLAKDFFINADAETVKEELKRYGASADNIPSPFIAVLIEHDDKKILIDAGVGNTQKPIFVKGNPMVFKGKLHQLLQEEGTKNTEVTDVIITHFHPDHIGGIFSEDGDLNFPNARFHMHEEEWNYWHSSQSDNQPEYFKLFIKKNITGLKNHDLKLIKGDFVELLPGITAVKAEGHTPGQIALIVHSKKDHFLYVSDAFLHPLHIEQLNWQTSYDLDHSKARASRIKLLELANKNNMLVNAFHFDFPGLGRIDKRGNDNWVWKYGEK